MENYLQKAGVTEKLIEEKKLNGKWIAVVLKDPVTGDPIMLTAKEQMDFKDFEGNTVSFAPGETISSEDSMIVMIAAEIMYPTLSGSHNQKGKNIRYERIRKKLTLH